MHLILMEKKEKKQALSWIEADLIVRGSTGPAAGD